MTKLYEVPQAFAAASRLRTDDYRRMYEESVRDPETFWGRMAARLDWMRPFGRVKDTSYRADDFHIRWYAGGRLNLAQNCLDRHLAKRGDKVAIIWEGDDPKDSIRLTYRELHQR